MLIYSPATFANDINACNWIFDFFALGFDHLARYFQPSSIPHVEALFEATFDEFTTLNLEEQISALDGDVPPQVWALLALPGKEEDQRGPKFLVRLFCILKLIDRAAGDLNYFRYGLRGTKWVGVRRRLELNDFNLTNKCDGRVTIAPPRLGREHPDAWWNKVLCAGWTKPPDRGLHHHRYFENLCRVFVSGCNIRHVKLSALDDLDNRNWDNFKIGFVPLLHDLELKADFAQCLPGPLRIVPAGPGKFSINVDSADPKSWDEVFRNVEGALEFFAANAVQIVVFPELTVPDALLMHIQKVLRRLSASHEQIRLVLAGTFLRGKEGLPGNVAVVLNGSGKVILNQRKMQPYEMKIYEQERYGLDPLFGRRDVEENISCVPRELLVCDCPSQGLRIAVMICEDACHQQPSISAVQAFRANLVLIPVMAGVLHPERSFSTTASLLAADPGAITVVCNSALLAERDWAKDPIPGYTPPPVGIVAMPLLCPKFKSKWFVSNYLSSPHASAKVLIFSVP